MGTGYRSDTLIGHIHIRRCIVSVSVSLLFLFGTTGCGLFERLSSPQSRREPEPPASVGGYSIQIGLYDTQKDAEQVADTVRTRTGKIASIIYKPPFYRVILTYEGDQTSVDTYVTELKSIGFTDARRVFTYDQ